MKKLNAVLLSISLPILIISCNDPNPEVSSHEHKLTSSISSIASSDIKGMSLNNGQKWLLDSHTRASLSKMKSSISKVEIGSAQPQLLKTLGSDLSQQLEELIQGCTMVDKEHDQLHLFLTAYIPAVKELSSTGSSESAQRVNHYLNNYTHYFK
jgi:hypothetical protein